MKERNVSIDILKCLAAILITNSHMQMLYPKFTFLATGGAVGDVLFFFCSGFTLFLKPMNGLCEFPNWYKHRINRIYPTVFAIAIITCSLFNSHPDINRIILHGGGWFVSCIMLYYVGIYFIGSYMKNKASLFGILVLIVSAIWFYSVYRTPEFLNIYNDTVHPIRWLMFFVFMLLGAKLGGLKNTQKSRPIMDCILLIICLVGFYSIYILTMHIDSIKGFQFFSVFPLLGVVYYFYRVFTSDWANKIYNSKIGYVFIRLIGGLCLEIYLIQHNLFTDKMNDIFPLNVPIMFAIIVFAAYITRCFARFISQTFKDEPYDWEKIVDWL